MTIEFKQGSIFDSDADMLVNPVNCIGVMGKGLAKEFKRRYPNMYPQYKKRCDTDTLSPGHLHLWISRPSILNFPTKYHWMDHSYIDVINKGLTLFSSDAFVDGLKYFKIKKVAFPALGCGEGGLSWEDVLPLMLEKLHNLDLDIEIYPPYNN